MSSNGRSRRSERACWTVRSPSATRWRREVSDASSTGGQIVYFARSSRSQAFSCVRMTIPPKTLSILVIVALAVAALALLIAIASAGRRKPKVQPSTLPIQLDDVLRGILEGHARALQRLEGAVRQLAMEDLRLGERLTGAVQAV